MVKKYIYGIPFETDAVVEQMKQEPEDAKLSVGKMELLENGGFSYTIPLEAADIIYGLGESNRGINKRGYVYESFCTDDPVHTEEKTSLYGAHNFIVISGSKQIGFFFDHPGRVRFDIGYTRQDQMVISAKEANFVLYEIMEESAYDVVRRFRKMIGQSYIAPKFAFGFGQSRWGYKTADDFRRVVQKYRENQIPLDLLYVDIDYMDRFMDFTVNPEEFPDFPAFVKEMQEQGVHLAPIIDAGVKIEPGYDVYEEGVENGYFCKNEDGTDFEATVWPGWTHFPDVLNPEARKWFGDKYERLISQGIDAFWNDMNEPAIFYSRRGLDALTRKAHAFHENGDEIVTWPLKDEVLGVANSLEDYKNMYHLIDGKLVSHERVHNLFGYNMTRAASEAFERIAPDRRFLMFSRASYIGMHRYGGVWTGDNHSWWSHILLSLKQMVNLNMCGFLYCGSDLGGFGANATRDLVLRFLALGVFSPLMRNHACMGTREQECYQFEHPEDFRGVIGARYRLLPYIYSEYMKAVLRSELYFKPLGFVYPADEIALQIEDQAMIADEVMIAPVYTQNAIGRPVYLPEPMTMVRFSGPDCELSEEKLAAGWQFVKVALNEVVFFVRSGRKIPIAEVAMTVDQIDETNLQYVGDQDAEYELYQDDGVTRDFL